MNRMRILTCTLLLALATFGLAQAAPGDTPTPTNQSERGERGERGGRTFDPAAMRERMMERYKEQLGASDEEWQVIQPRIEAVSNAQRAERELQASSRGRWGGNSEPNPTVTAVEKAIEANDTAGVKASLNALRAARAANAAEQATAKASLREVLSVNQEARLVLMGMLD